MAVRRPRRISAPIPPRPTSISGTDMTIVQAGIPEAIPVEMCYLGWQESLMLLAQLVEPEIPG